MSVPVKNHKPRMRFAIPLDLTRALSVELGAHGFRERDKFSVFGAIMQAMYTSKDKHVFVPESGVSSLDFGKIRWAVGARKVADIERAEMAAVNDPEKLNQLRLDAIKLLLDNDIIELPDEKDREQAVELGLIEIKLEL